MKTKMTISVESENFAKELKAFLKKREMSVGQFLQEKLEEEKEKACGRKRVKIDPKLRALQKRFQEALANAKALEEEVTAKDQ